MIGFTPCHAGCYFKENSVNGPGSCCGRNVVVELGRTWHYRAQHNRTYWRARAIAGRLVFRLKAGLFQLVGFFRATRESGAILYGIGRVIAFSGLAAVGLVGILSTLERILFANLSLLPEELANWLRSLATSTRFEALDSVLLTLLQVIGVFLGLYFTAVSVVASTVYARVQADIRDLLTREKVGNSYLRLLVLVAAMSLTILAASVIGHQPGILTSLFTLTLGFFALLSFLPLGNRIFRFFDPTSLVELYIVSEVEDWVRRASPAGFAWHDVNFQMHYQNAAESRLETYLNIVRLAVTREHLRQGSLVRLANRSLRLLRHYASIKNSIPSESLWFKRVARHKDWFRIGAHDADLAVRASTAHMYDAVPDPMWFEDYVFEINRIALTHFWATATTRIAYRCQSISELPMLHRQGSTIRRAPFTCTPAIRRFCWIT